MHPLFLSLAPVQLFGSALLAIIAILSHPAHAQPAYPSNPIRVIVPVPPGGAPDTVARLVGEKLEAQFGQPIVVENKSGASGNIAADFVVRAEPNGYVLLLGYDSLITVNPHLYANLKFDARTDLMPVASLGSNDFVFSVNPSVPAKTFKEFIEYAGKADPPLNFASGGRGSQHQLATEMLMQRAGIKLQHIPFRGGSAAAAATVAGDTQMMFSGASSAPMIAASRLRALATTGAKQSVDFPDLPNIGSVYPGYEVSIWLGLFAPKGTPDAIVQRLHDGVNKALADTELQAKLHKAGGLTAMPLTIAEFKVIIKNDDEKYGKLVRDLGIKLEQ